MGIGHRCGDYTTKAPRSSEGERRAKEFERKKEESTLDETRVRDTSTAATRTIICVRALRHTLHGEDDLSCEVHVAFRALRQTHLAHTLHVEARSLPSCMLSGNPGHQGMPPHRMPWCARGVPQERCRCTARPLIYDRRRKERLHRVGMVVLCRRIYGVCGEPSSHDITGVTDVSFRTRRSFMVIESDSGAFAEETQTGNCGR